jgi:polysaccharide transporter, PST family
MKWPSEFRPSQLLRHVLVQNAMSLFGVQVASYIVPLVTIPYLARVLGAAAWGKVAFAQAFGSYISLLGGYGFALSGTREVARNRESREKLSEILAGVLGAEGLLCGAAMVVALLARHWIPILRADRALFWAAMLWALAQAFSVMWFFQGLERMRLVATLDISAKALAVVGIFVLVRAPQDGWIVLVVQGLALAVSFGIGLGFAYSQLPLQLPRWGWSWSALRMGWSMFLFRGSVSLYTVGNAFILGLFVSPQLVGYYAGAEKISRAFWALLNPINQTVYPHMNHLVQYARERAIRLARISVVIMGLCGSFMGALVFLCAPLLVRAILGQGYAPAASVLRILALLPPLIALSNVFGIQWMLPLGLDRPLNVIIITAGVLNLSLAAILAPSYGATGMAWAVVSAETLVTGGIYLFLRWQQLDPMSYRAEFNRETILSGRAPAVPIYPDR